MRSALSRSPLAPLRFAAFAAIVSSAALVACSGAKESDLLFSGESSTFGNEPKAGASSSGTSGTSSGESSSGESSSGSSGASSGASSSGASSGGSSGASSSGGSSGTSSGGSSGTSSGGSSGSSGTSSSGGSSGWPGTPKDIKCGKEPGGADRICSSPNVCCATKVGSGVKYGCDNVFGCGGTPISCASSADCGGATPVCCGTFDTNVGYQRVACSTEAACTATIPNVQMLRFCDKAAPVDECLAIGKTCQPSSSLPGFYRCN
jgi:hypothetical protein